MQQGRATSRKGQGKTQGRLWGVGVVDLTGGIYHSLKMLALYQTHKCICLNMHEEIIHMHTCPLHDRRSLMNVALRRPLRGSKATLTPTSDRAGHREALARLHFPRLPDWQAVPRQVCSVKGWGPFLCLPVAVWQRHGRSALKECLFAAITVAGTVMGPFSSTIPTLSFSPFLCLYWCAPGTLSWYPTHTVSVLWPHSSDCINSDYGRIILVCLAIKYTHVWLSRAASQAFIGTSPSPI